MIIDLRTLQLYPGKNEHFELEASGREELLADEQACFLDPVKVSIEVSNQGRYFSGQGRFNTRIQLACSRCLEALIWPISSEFEFTVVLDTVKESSNDDEDTLFYGSGLVDIAPLIEELIIIEVPFTPICSEECQGLCPICGSNKNMQKCSCQKDDIDPRWEKLRNI